MTVQYGVWAGAAEQSEAEVKVCHASSPVSRDYSVT
jgi:hypothetical protein